MLYPKITPVPNCIFDTYMPSLTEAELKVLLVVIRQTLGWKDRHTGGRKQRDRITASQFGVKTGLSKRVITKAIDRLVQKGLVSVSDFHGVQLRSAFERKGKAYLFYSLTIPAHLTTETKAQSIPGSAHNVHHNKTKRKEARQSDTHFSGHIAELIKQKEIYQEHLV